jgi:hypothetical protein
MVKRIADIEGGIVKWKIRRRDSEDKNIIIIYGIGVVVG